MFRAAISTCGIVGLLSGIPLASAGTISGSVILPEQSQRPRRPIHVKGFVERSENPIRPAKRFDPSPTMVVVLEGNVPISAQKAPNQPVPYNFAGERFSNDILPVVVGSKINIINSGKRSLRLYSTTHPDIVPGDTINPKGRRTSQPISDLRMPMEIRDREAPHVRATVIGFEHPYFSTINNGTFSIKDVPDGLWKVRIWHGDGWIKLKRPISVTSPQKPGSLKIELPAKITKEAS